jgi:hypothetical protein
MLLPNALVAVLTATVAVVAGDTSSTVANLTAAELTAAIDDIQPSVAPRTWTTIVLHHSATRGGSVESIDAAHRNNRDSSGNPWLGIGYHFVVGNGQSMADGEIRPTFRWQRQLPGAHCGTRDHNEHGIGICLIGDFGQAVPTARQMGAVTALLKSLATRYSIPRQRLHRHLDLQATLCPGRMFPWEQVRLELPLASGP